eukprot:7169468-Pyramimonas_sp.AAC.1
MRDVRGGGRGGRGSRRDHPAGDASDGEEMRGSTGRGSSFGAATPSTRSERKEEEEKAEEEEEEGGSAVINEGPWTPKEKELYLEAVRLHGRDFVRIKEHVGSKTLVAVRAFWGRQRKRLSLDKLVEEHTNGGPKDGGDSGGPPLERGG